jgi:nitrous-oxide reductase
VNRHQIIAALTVLVTLASLVSCFSESRLNRQEASKDVVTEIPAGELAKAAVARGLSAGDVLAAVKTYVPSGGRDTLIGVLTAGSSGRLAVVGLPSMRILKYVGVFTPEPWQGFAYDDESRAILQASARDEISYSFGLSGRPAFSRTTGDFDGRAIFVGDGANARVAVVDLDDYEVKQIVTNPRFHMAHPGVSTSENSEFVLQTTAAPEILDGGRALKGAATLWHTSLDDDKLRLHDGHATTLELPPYFFGASRGGHGPSGELFFVPGACEEPDVCGTGSVLEVIQWKRAAGIENSAGRLVPLATAVSHQALWQYKTAAGLEAFAVSPSGKRGALAFRSGAKVLIVDLEKARAADPGAMVKDPSGVPSASIDEITIATVEDSGGPAVDLAFVRDDVLYVTAADRLVKIDAAKGRVTETRALGYTGGKLLVSGFGSAHPGDAYAVVVNPKPHGRYLSVGPVAGMNAELFDLSAPGLPALYDMSVPQATALDGEIIPADRIAGVIRYKPGTDTRTSKASPFGTIPGQERVVKNGRRVEVFGTLIRSHINPEIVEVDEGDIVTFHMTNLEQAQDQTHGFTVDTYNVHGSWEPGKTASLTFVADRPGVFPYYCTEFCSALHLEMEGYLLVKPKGWKGTDNISKPGEVFDPAGAKAEFEAKTKSIADTAKTIDSVVAWLKEHDYAKDARAKALVEDALEQLQRAKEIQPKIDAAVKAGDWETAKLWAEQFFQYQVKCADAGLRAKRILSEGASK